MPVLPLHEPKFLFAAPLRADALIAVLSLAKKSVDADAF